MTFFQIGLDVLEEMVKIEPLPLLSGPDLGVMHQTVPCCSDNQVLLLALARGWRDYLHCLRLLG